ncbi:MAG: DNA alkylation repair protein [Sediminibacterium sp.]|jgi:3-methyladenine DNA glycosylase AlkD|nr:DNA alkylation repair protein [Chitinophagaceae bacterium]
MAVLHPYLLPLDQAFRQKANTSKALGMKAYMLNQFEFFGIPAPQRQSIQKQFLKEHNISSKKQLEAVIKNCFKQPQREYQYFAIYLYAVNKRYWTKESDIFIEYCLLQKSWWDTVDGIASDWLKAYFTLFPTQIKVVTNRWNQSNNIWLIRSSIMFQKAFKKDTDTRLLSKYILQHKISDEFFIQKAIGWALREYSKVNPKWVKEFVEANDLTPLSKREALKRL